MSTLLAYLQDSTFLNSTASLHLPYAEREQLLYEAKDLFVRLYPEKPEDGNNQTAEPDPDPIPEGPPPPKKKYANKLQGQLAENKAKRAQNKAAKRSTALRKIAIDMESFEATGKRPENLEQIYKALSSVPPTSAESEVRHICIGSVPDTVWNRLTNEFENIVFFQRAFSCVGLYVTKLRTRLSDRSIDNLFFLRKNLP